MKVMKVYKVIIALLIASLVFILMNSCEKPSEEIVTKSINLESFETINVKSFGDFLIQYGTEQKIVFNGSKEVFNTLSLNVVNNQLIIDNKVLMTRKNHLSEFIITIPRIKAVKIEGAADFVLNEFKQADDLNIDISGNGTFKIHSFENTNKFKIDISGNGEIEVLENFSSLNVLDINISGNGKYRGYLTEANACNIDISGSGDVKVWVKERLNVKISGNANVYYKGKPSVVSKIIGIGDLVEQN